MPKETTMYRNLFTAWYCLGVFVLCMAAFLIAWPFVGADRARGGFGFLGMLGLLPIFWLFVFRKEPNDERDVSFLQRSALIGFANGVAVIYALNGLLDFVYRVRFGFDAIPLSVFWLPSTCGMVVGVLLFSVTLLLFYYKGEDADKEVR